MDQTYHGTLQNDLLYSMICASSSAPGRGGVFNQFVHHEFVPLSWHVCKILTVGTQTMGFTAHRVKNYPAHYGILKRGFSSVANKKE